MLHRAIVGSMERFIGILIEHHAGHFPAWLAPVQAVVMNITDAQADWVDEVRKTLANQGFRVDADLRNEKIGYKIREHTLQRVPYLLVVGDREKDNGAVAVRTRSGEDLGTMSVADFAARLRGRMLSRQHAAVRVSPGRPSAAGTFHPGDRHISTPDRSRTARTRRSACRACA